MAHQYAPCLCNKKKKKAGEFICWPGTGLLLSWALVFSLAVTNIRGNHLKGEGFIWAVISVHSLAGCLAVGPRQGGTSHCHTGERGENGVHASPVTASSS